MPGIISVISTAIVNKCRLIKCTLMGLNDTRTPKEVSPHGIDSCPLPDARGLYIETSKKGAYVVAGYTTVEKKSTTGETRVFSTNLSGISAAQIWLRTTGTLELNGNADNAVKHLALNTALQAEAVKINNNLSAILANLTQLNVAVNALAPGSVTTPYVVTPVTVDISAAKVNNVRVG